MEQNVKANLISQFIPKRFVLFTSIRVLIFFILFISTISSSLSKGLFISASDEIKKDFQLSERAFGIFGSLFDLGKILGGIILTLIISKISRKLLIILLLFLNGSLATSFMFISDKIAIMIIYFFLGITNMSLAVYVPIWVDQFAINKYKTLCLTLVQFGEAFGLSFGYILNYFVTPNGYKIGFLIEGILLEISAFILIFFSSLYFSSRVLIIKEANDTEKFNIKSSNENNKEKSDSIASLFRIRQSNESTYELDFVTKIQVIMTNPVFITAVLSMTIMLTSQTGFNFWVIDYMTNTLKMQKPNQKLIAYIGLTMAGPAGGLITSLIVTLTLGNYEHTFSPFVMFILYLFACAAGNSLIYFDSIGPFFGFGVLYVVLCASAKPMIQGLCITSTTQSLKGTEFAIANLIINLFGIVPSPYLYGILHDKFKKNDNRFAMGCLMKYFILGVIINFAAVILKCRTGTREKYFHMKSESELKETNLDDNKSKNSETISKNSSNFVRREEQLDESMHQESDH